MRFIAGNVEFTDNMKQLLPDLSIFDKIIRNEPSILQNRLWKKQTLLTTSGISSGSLTNPSDNIFYRSCYLLYKSGVTIQNANVSLTVTNVNSSEVIPSSEFKNWGLVQIDEGLYLLFVWIDIEQRYTFNLSTNVFNAEDWFIQVVI